MTPVELKHLRQQLGLTQEELAEVLGVEWLAVARWETGLRGISEPITRLLERIRAEARGEEGREKRRRAVEQPERGRKGQPPKTVYLEIGIMMNPEDGHIRIFSWGDTEFVTTVCDIPGSKRSHPHLYGKLRTILERAGKWPPKMKQWERRG